MLISSPVTCCIRQSAQLHDLHPKQYTTSCFSVSHTMIFQPVFCMVVLWYAAAMLQSGMFEQCCLQHCSARGCQRCVGPFKSLQSFGTHKYKHNRW